VLLILIGGFSVFLGYTCIVPLDFFPLFRFTRDWLAFAGFLFFALPSLWLQRQMGLPARLNLLGCFALVLLGVFGLQWALGLVGQWWRLGLVQAAYLVAMMVLAVAVQGWVAAGRGAWVAAGLGLGLVLGASANALAMVAQVFHQEAWFLGWVQRVDDLRRAEGLIGQPNLAATLCMLALWALIQADRTCWPQGGPRAWIARGLGLLLLTGLVMSGSRTGLIELAVVSVWLWLSQRSRPSALFWRCLPLAYLLIDACLSFYVHDAAPALPLVLSRLTTPHEGRWAIWRMAWEMGWSSPWWGVGWREMAYAQLTAPLVSVAPAYVDHVHNLLAQLWAETGLLGLLPLLGLAAYTLAHDRPWANKTPTVSFALGVLLILLIHSMTEFPLWWAFLLFVFVIAFSLLPGTTVAWSWHVTVAAALALAAMLYPIKQDAALLAPLHQLTIGDSPATREQAWALARQSVWFAPVVERLALLRQPPARAHLAQDLERSQRLLHLSPDPALITWRLRALVLAGDTAQALHVAQRMQAIHRQAWCVMVRRGVQTPLYAAEPEFVAWLSALPAGLTCPP